jgi:hypothetical protein
MARGKRSSSAEKPTKPSTPAARIIRQLEAAGRSRLAIADDLHVSFFTVRRWALGLHQPIPGHMERLRQLLNATRAEGKPK